MDDKKPVEAQELADEELEKVAGGRRYFATTSGRYFHYVGRLADSDGYEDDWNKRYLCPNCGKPVHCGRWDRYYCDPCDESWYNENKLMINLGSGLYEEITKQEFERDKAWWE